MKFDEGKDFDQNMNQLVHLLRKIIKGLPLGQIPPVSLPHKDKESSVQVNFCFFNFLPMTEEEMEAMDDMFDSMAPEEDREGSPRQSSAELNPSDLDFLKRHGIRF